MTSLPHPLAQLSEQEFIKARDVIVQHHGADESLFFRSIYLHEPKKAELVPFLQAEHSGDPSKNTDRPPREAYVEYDVVHSDHYEYTRSVVNVVTGEVVSAEAVGRTSQPYFTV